jgi:fructose-1,6-bisphosphatase/inositol monophosphatase family enzyme
MSNLTLDDLTALARTAGDMMRNDFRFEGIHRDFKSDGSPNITPVTDSDKRINRFVIDALRKKASPAELSITGEEESDDSAQAPVRVFVDPIDGTFPFASGIPVSTFMLAVVEDNAPRLSVIYDPFGDQLYLAEKGKGATLNGKPIHVGASRSLSNKTIVGSVWWEHRPVQHRASERAVADTARCLGDQPALDWLHGEQSGHRRVCSDGVPGRQCT